VRSLKIEGVKVNWERTHPKMKFINLVFKRLYISENVGERKALKIMSDNQRLSEQEMNRRTDLIHFQNISHGLKIRFQSTSQYGLKK